MMVEEDSSILLEGFEMSFMDVAIIIIIIMVLDKLLVKDFQYKRSYFGLVLDISTRVDSRSFTCIMSLV